MKEYLSGMPGRKKAEYIWTYYKGYFIAVLLMILAIGLPAAMFSQKEKKEILNGILVNEYLDSETIEAVEQELLKAAGGNPEEEQVYVDASIVLNLQEQDADTLNNLAKITTYVFGKELDFIIAEPDVADHFQELNGLENLRECLSGQAMDMLQDKLYFGSGGGSVPYGIYLEDTAFYSRYKMTLNNPVLCIVHNSPEKFRMEAVVKNLFQAE